MPTIIEMPAIKGWEDVSFDPVQPRNMNRMEGRFTEGQTFGIAYWNGVWTAGYLSPRDYGLIDAFIMEAGDQDVVFRGYDVFRPRPIAHDSGRPLTTPTATITARTSQSLTLSGLPSQFIFRRGDYIEVRKSDTLISLHRVIRDAQANGAGVVTVQIRYNLDLQNFELPLTANLEKPSCLMQLTPGFTGAKSWNSRSPSISGTEVFFS